jgi:hypothetical protein
MSPMASTIWASSSGKWRVSGFRTDNRPSWTQIDFLISSLSLPAHRVLNLLLFIVEGNQHERKGELDQVD